MNPEQLGPYRLVRVIGRGGMGTVFEGVSIETGEAAAIKSLSPLLSHHEDFRQRFEAEIETLRKLRHPNIVRLFGFGEQEGQLYYAMELVDGQSLEEEIKLGRRFNWREVTVIGIEMCRALRHAHDRGVVHRDIKPANLLLERGGQVKLSAFGIARLFGNTGLTAAGNVLGTVEYMAPEQADARPTGPRSDLYSLGGVLFALLAGRPPFKAKSILEMLELQRTAIPDRVSQHAYGVPTELEAIIAQLLEKDPDKRPANAMLLSRRLEAMLHALSLSPRTSVGEVETGRESVTAFELAAPAEAPRLSPVDGLTVTRVSEEHGSAQQAATELHSLVVQPPSGAGNLPETRATSAFLAFPQAPGATPPDENTVPPEPPRKPADRFVVVAEDELDRYEPEEPPHAALVSLHTWILAASLVAVGITLWYLLQPPSADKLYSKIREQTSDKSVDSLRGARYDIERFLARYSSDPRAGTLRKYVQELELADMERDFDNRARAGGRVESLLPIERAYQEAINYARVDPERGMVKLQALLDLYNHRTDISGPTGKCLELARRRLEQLQNLVQETSSDHLAMVEDRLDRAEQLRESDPQRARQMWKAVIELYEAKPWAAAAVRRAREALAQSANPDP